jgi:hypothetical protein
MQRLPLAMAVPHCKADRQRLLITFLRLLRLAELDADVAEVLQGASLTGGVSHFPADR